MLLRRFAIRKKRDWYIHVFDKRSERSFFTNIRNVTTERGFYDFHVDGVPFRLENTLSVLETNTSEAFEKLIGERRISALDENDILWIGLFISAQHMRVRHFREMILEMDKQFSQRLASIGYDADDIKRVVPNRPEDDLKKFATHILLESIEELSSAICNKKWALMETTRQNPFWIGDNPVTMHNDRDFGPYGNIGFSVPGIQIHLPLTNTLTLALWCPTLLKEMTESCKETPALIQKAQATLVLGANVDREHLSKHIENARKMQARNAEALASIESGKPIRCSTENVMFLNSLQARWADRYVMASTGQFSMASRMLRDFPKSRRGPRIQVS